tara:strand:- start:5898 stop:6230 length:333 start_codon:yes stop_codon:yes gene_type:complete
MENIIDYYVMCDNKAVLSFWEESNGDNDLSLDGCSLHLTESDRKEYIKDIYSNRKGDIPDSYDRPIGDFGYNAYITNEINERLIKEKSIRLSQVELKNLMNMEEVVIEYL